MKLSEFLVCSKLLVSYTPCTHLTAFSFSSHTVWSDVWFLGVCAHHSTCLVVFWGPLTSLTSVKCRWKCYLSVKPFWCVYVCMCVRACVLGGGCRTNEHQQLIFSFPQKSHVVKLGWGVEVGAVVFNFQLKPPATSYVHWRTTRTDFHT